jgi:predicted acylesterase/phospholipase RssA
MLAERLGHQSPHVATSVTGENTIANRTAARIASKPYQILGLSGGGFRGLYTAKLLEILEVDANKPLSQVFDLIADTSIGGILALGLAMGILPKHSVKPSRQTAHLSQTSNRNS